MVKYDFEQFKNDPRTKGRSNWALIKCIEEGRTTVPEIFAEIDKVYSTGRHHSPSYIKYRKVQAIKLLNQFFPENPTSNSRANKGAGG